jgi:hypothetical protein
MPAGHALVVVVVALVLGALFNAGDLRATAERQPFGWQRTVALAAARPLDATSRALRLDRPRAAIDVALGRAQPTRDVAAAAEASARPSPAAPEAPSPSPTPSPSEPARREVTAAEPLRLYVGGDSMVGQFGPAMANLADKSGMVDAEFVYEFESGLTRPDFIDWPARLREVGETIDPDAVVLFFGGNDAQPLKIDGTVYEPGAPEWQAEYRSRVDAFMDQLVAAGRDVYWMGMPIVKSPTFQPRVDMLNAIYASEAEAHDGVTFVPTHDLFAGPDGTYSEYLPDASGDTVDMRLNDGVHFTTAGAQRLADVVFPLIAGNWDIPTADG